MKNKIAKTFGLLLCALFLGACATEEQSHPLGFGYAALGLRGMDENENNFTGVWKSSEIHCNFYETPMKNEISGAYKYGMPIGKFQKTWENGWLEIEEIYDENGNIKVVTYFPDGEIRSIWKREFVKNERSEFADGPKVEKNAAICDSLITFDDKWLGLKKSLSEIFNLKSGHITNKIYSLISIDGAEAYMIGELCYDRLGDFVFWACVSPKDKSMKELAAKIVILGKFDFENGEVKIESEKLSGKYSVKFEHNKNVFHMTVFYDNKKVFEQIREEFRRNDETTALEKSGCPGRYLTTSWHNLRRIEI